MTDNFAHRAADWDQPSKIDMTNIFVNALQQNIEFKKQWVALEIGAGTGLVGLQILPKVDKMIFEDTSEAMLQVLQSKLTGDENIEICLGEIFACHTKIDFACSCMAFHHIPDIDAALTHLSSICNPNAIVAIGDIRSEDGSFHRFEPIPHKGFDTDELSIKFEKAGFVIEKCYTYNVLKRERVAGIMSEYEQFLLVARKTQ